MFRKWITPLIIAFPFILSANPLPSTVYPVISEVQWIDSLNWSIELRSYGILHNKMPLSFTTDSVRLFLLSSNTTYSTLLQFNSEGIAVLTRSSITGIPDNQKVIIKRNEKIFIYQIGVYKDPPYSYIDEYYDLGWICDIGNLEKNGNSLIGVGYQEFIESSRSSIGTKGNYTTTNRLYVKDRNGNPVPDVFLHHHSFQDKKIKGHFNDSNVNQYLSGPDGQIAMSVVIGGYAIAYLYDNPVNFQYNLSDFEKSNIIDTILPAWYFSYHDDFTEYRDTIIITPAFFKTTVLDSNGNLYDWLVPKINGIPVGTRIDQGTYIVRLFNPGEYPIEFYQTNDSIIVAACTLEYVDTRDTLTKKITASTTPVKPDMKRSIYGTEPRIEFSALGDLSSGIRFVFATKVPLNQASITVCLLNGKKVATIQIPSGAPGTHSVHWNTTDASGKKLPSGNYLCNLQIGQKTVSSKKVTAF